MSPDDATHLARHTLPELGPHDLAHLDAFHAAARLLHHGAETRAFTLNTRPLPPPLSPPRPPRSPTDIPGQRDATRYPPRRPPSAAPPGGAASRGGRGGESRAGGSAPASPTRVARGL